jgi:hypothetical protein
VLRLWLHLRDVAGNLGGYHRLGIAAVVRDAGYAKVAAVDQRATPARLAMSAMPSKPADANPLPGAPADHAGAEPVDHAGDLVPRDAWKGEAGPLPFDGEAVAVAHTAGLDANATLTPRGFGHVALDEFKRTAGPRHLHRPCYGPSVVVVGIAPVTPISRLVFLSFSRSHRCMERRISVSVVDLADPVTWGLSRNAGLLPDALRKGGIKLALDHCRAIARRQVEELERTGVGDSAIRRAGRQNGNS